MTATNSASTVSIAACREDEMLELDTQQHFVSLLWPLWSNRRSLLRAFLVGTLISFLIAFFIIPKHYESTVELLPPQDRSGSLYGLLGAATGGGSAFSMASELLGSKTSSAVFVTMLASRTVQDEVVNRFNLKQVYRVRRQVDARKILEANTDVSEDRKSSVITLSVRDRSPARAAALAHGYVEALNHVVAHSGTSAAHRERVFLEERLGEVKQDLEKAEKQFSEFASKNNTLDIKDQGKAMIESAAVLQGQLIAAESELKGLQQIYAAENFRVRAANARIAELKQQLNSLAGTTAGNPRPDGEESDALYPSIHNLPILGVVWADLYREAKIQEAVFETLTKQYELAKVEEAKEIPTVGLLDDAEVPEKKASPPRLILTLAGGFISALLFAFYFIGRDIWTKVDPTSPLYSFVSTVSNEVSTSRFGTWLYRVRQRIRPKSRSQGSHDREGPFVQNVST